MDRNQSRCNAVEHLNYGQVEGVTMAKDRIVAPALAENGYDFIDDVDRTLNPLGRYHRHNYMHSGAIPMVFDEFGRCAYCVKNGQWKPDA
jgi:hypothetical protein